MTSNLTQDSGIHTMSSRRESGFGENVRQTVPECFQRRANSDCLPVSHNYCRGISTHSVDNITNKLQQVPIFGNQLSMNANPEQISVFSQTGSVCGLQASNRNCNNCSQQCCHAIDPGGGVLQNGCTQRISCHSDRNPPSYNYYHEPTQDYAGLYETILKKHRFYS